MFDANRILDQLLGAAEGVAGRDKVDGLRRQMAANPGMTKAAGLGLAGILFGTRGGRALTGSAVRLGGLALVGGLAWKAWQAYQAGQRGQIQTGSARQLERAPADTAFDGPARVMPAGEAERERQDRARNFLAAMIAAAKADGHIDAEERARILGQLEQVAEGAEARDFLRGLMEGPADPDRIGALATSPERAAEIYAASCLAITADTPMERAYLDRLAQAMRLDPELRRQIETAVQDERNAA